MATLIRAQSYRFIIPDEPARVVEVADVTMLSKTIDQWKVTQWKNGYPFAALDSIVDLGVYLFKGSKSKVIIDTLFLENGDFHTTTYSNAWKGLAEELKFWSDHGYPFTQVSLHKSAIAYNIMIDRGPYIEFDSLDVKGETPIVQEEVLVDILNINLGRPYSETSYQKIQQRIQRLPFVKLKKMPDVYFENNKATVQLDLQKTQNNSFEGVIGILPRQGQSENVLVTGFVDVNLINLFQSAKSLRMTWNRFGDESQELDINYFHPFIAGTPLLFDFDFSLLKQDTSFLNQSTSFGLGTYLAAGKLFFRYNRQTGSLISEGSISTDQTIIPQTTSTYSVGFEYASSSRPFSYADKFDFRTHVGIGSRRLDRQDTIFNLKGKSPVVQINLTMREQIRITEYLKIFNATRLGIIENEQIFSNEKYRIGGLRTLRGFNENELFVSSFILNRLELRQYFESKSYFYLFQDIMIAYQTNDRIAPFGFGSGFSIQTQSGLLNFALALGKIGNSALNPLEAKIHIGYTSKF